ncbi:hypothetical protein [Streptomyces sp. NPDC051211]|uniref:hypothetical protein n=1 Tax=Streptomyces sp. NPDC051211 TaxID=3154643 RepID=UPI00344F4105
MVGRRIRFAAVLVAVVFALTGFSTGGGSGGSKGSSKSSSKSSGGGCSSSKSKNKSKNKNRTTSHGGSGSTASAAPSPTRTDEPATAFVTTCAGPSGPATTVSITSRLGRKETFEVSVHLEGASGTGIEVDRGTITLDPRQTRTFTIAMTAPARAADVRNCRIGLVRTVSGPAAVRSTGPAVPAPKVTPKPKTTKPRTKR